ncbi:conserved hypothetical protein [Klebsiella quasipneumoniae subsp. similipneumoniae]|nr:conserved hypothetical protein [Klebsiella quasipneumoniae subsp. similipneumoniae]
MPICASCSAVKVAGASAAEAIAGSKTALSRATERYFLWPDIVGILAISEQQVSLYDKISPFFAEALPDGALIRNFIFQAQVPRASARAGASGQRSPGGVPCAAAFRGIYFRWFLSICMRFFNNGTWQ